MRQERGPVSRFALALFLAALTAVSSFAADWEALGQVSKTQTVTVHLRSGQELKGTIRQVEPESLTLVPRGVIPPGITQTGGVVRLERADITRVTRQKRLIAMAIGAAILGGATAIGLSFDSSPKDTPGVKGAAILGLTGAGAGLGAVAGFRSTIYKAAKAIPEKKQKGGAEQLRQQQPTAP